MLRAIDDLAALSLTDWWPVRAVLLAATLVVVALVLLHARRIASVLLATVLLAGLVTADLLLAANAYYGTYPNLTSFLGGTRPPAPEAAGTLPPTGQTVPVSIPGARSGFVARPAMVHLPRAWFAEPRPSLPVVMLLHGTPGAPQEWLDPGAADRVADAWADRNGGVAPVLVLPDHTGAGGFGVCADTATGNVETYLTDDVPAFVQAQFSTRAPGSSWAVVGHSAGGTCAMTLALRHPGLFATFADFGGSGIGADAEHDPALLLRTGALPGLAGWFQVGGADPASGAARLLAPLAAAAGVQTCLVVTPGAGAGPATWSLAFADALPWLAARVGQVPQAPEMTSACQSLRP